MNVMNSIITSPPDRMASTGVTSSSKVKHSVVFADRLQEYSDRAAPQSKSGAVPSSSAVLVGEISRSHQTVSELLMAHSELKSQTWNILSQNQNRSKDYTKLSPGTKVYYNSEDRSLSWSGSAQPSTSSAQHLPPMPPPIAAPVILMQETGLTQPIQPTPIASMGVSLGVISGESPTVSHLLKAHPEFQNDTWNILSSAMNRDKPFHKIASGTNIYLQPGSMEIVWDQPGGSNQISPQVIAATQLPVKVVPDQNTLTTTAADSVADLTEAVQPYLGRPYKEINCYELLVKGLEGMGIPYAGKDGLFSKLTAMAREKGLPANAFLNGEGIIKAAGSLVLSRSFPRSSDWKQEAEQLYSEMEPLLNKGQILSLSTRKRGHTGIISQQQNQWTFINSGRLDNSLTADSPSRGVGEEVLKREIRNWFKLASTSKESLTVTLGALGQEKVVASYSPQKPVSASKHI